MAKKVSAKDEEVLNTNETEVEVIGGSTGGNGDGASADNGASGTAPDARTGNDARSEQGREDVPAVTFSTTELYSSGSRAAVDPDVGKKAMVDRYNEPVRVKMGVTHNFNVAGIGYSLEAGKAYMIPRHVMMILKKAGKLVPLVDY